MFNTLKVYAGLINDTDTKNNEPDGKITQAVKKTRIESYPCNECHITFDREINSERYNCTDKDEPTEKQTPEHSGETTCCDSQSDVAEHKLINNNKKLLTCEYCDRIFKLQSSLDKHKALFHQKLACPKCNQPFCKKTELIGHLKERHGLTGAESLSACDYDKSFTIKKSPITGEIFYRLPCKKQYVSLANLQIHCKFCTVCELKKVVLPAQATETAVINSSHNDQILFATDKAEKTQHEDETLICTDKSTQKIYSYETHEIALRQENIINSLNLSTINNRTDIDALKDIWLEITSEIILNLLQIEKSISHGDSLCIATVFNNITKSITQIKKLIPLFQYADLIITGSKNTDKIGIISTIFGYIEIVAAAGVFNNENLIWLLSDQVNTTCDHVSEVFKDWCHVLPKTKKIYSPDTSMAFSPEQLLVSCSDQPCLQPVNKDIQHDDE
ncbi:MAG: C2H2-type zinc finger protein [Endozoicomonadaceae bacterium]|nr:C2H2-type zinc finger protein [Endozoicomonadaceae bacterium]